jgi:hypothetical protein
MYNHSIQHESTREHTRAHEHTSTPQSYEQSCTPHTHLTIVGAKLCSSLLLLCWLVVMAWHGMASHWRKTVKVQPIHTKYEQFIPIHAKYNRFSLLKPLETSLRPEKHDPRACSESLESRKHGQMDTHSRFHKQPQ